MRHWHTLNSVWLGASTSILFIIQEVLLWRLVLYLLLAKASGGSVEDFFSSPSKIRVSFLSFTIFLFSLRSPFRQMQFLIPSSRCGITNTHDSRLSTTIPMSMKRVDFRQISTCHMS